MRKRIDSPSADDEVLMESLLQRRADAIEPRASFHHELYGKLMRSYIHDRAKRPNMLHILDFLLVGKGLATATVLFIFIASSSIVTSYAYNATDVTRDTNLYILKEAVENLRVALSTAPDTKASVQLDLADRRKDELVYMTSQGRVDAETINRMLESIRQASFLSDQVTEETRRAELKELINKSSRDKKEELLQLIALLESQMSSSASSGENASQNASETTLVESSHSSSAPTIPLGPDSRADISSLRQTATALEQIEQETQSPLSSPDTPQAQEIRSSSSIAARQAIASSGEAIQRDAASASNTARPHSLPPNRNDIRSQADIRLSIEGSSIFSTQSDAVMTLIVDNAGETAATAFSVSYDWGDGNEDSVTVDRLSIGERISVPIRHHYATTGQFFLTAVANSGRTVRESTESNNSKRAFIQIQDKAPACNSNCGIAGDKRCANNGVSTCVQKGDNCLQWSQPISCGDSLCSSGSCQATH